MDRDRLAYLYDRFKQNRCSAAEREEFLHFLRTPEGKTRLDSLLAEFWRHTSSTPLPKDRAECIVSDILENESASIRLDPPRRVPVWWRVAAAVVLLALATGAVALFLPSNDIRESPEAPGTPTRYVKLSDGSTVVLKAGSSLDYPPVFEGPTRTVSLVGEAYFDIAHDSIHPFIVHTGKVRTTVLGTAFNIRAYPDQGDITVTVTRGKVEVSDDKRVFGIVTPDRQITLRPQQQQTKEQVVDARSVARWIEKDIFFDDLTIKEVAEQLEKRFDVNIQFDDTVVQRCRLTATFVRGESIKQILNIISEFNGAEVVEEKPGTYVLNGGGCP